MGFRYLLVCTKSMKINSGPIQTYARTGLRDAESQRVASQPLERVQRPNSEAPVETTTETSPANPQVVEQAPVVAQVTSTAVQPRHQVYSIPSSNSHLPASRQSAMQAYTSTQQMSREVFGSGEFLGSIDLFV